MTGDDVSHMFAVSLDGFVARQDGSIDWLDDYPPDAGRAGDRGLTIVNPFAHSPASIL
jgi:dihydrofolate reductase